MSKQQNLGQYFTKQSVWLKTHILSFIEAQNFKMVIDPYAGGGDILKLFNAYKTKGFDIDTNFDWEINDSLLKIPYIKNGIVITNPPFLARNSATKNNSSSYTYFIGNEYQDLYQLAIEKVLETYSKAVFIIPETFLTSKFHKESLESLTILEENPFSDTECPVCVCCFKHRLFKIPEYDIYKNDTFLFTSNTLNDIIRVYDIKHGIKIKFNDVNGNLALVGVDSTNSKNRIRFCKPEDLKYDLSKIKESSRAITIMSIDYEVDTDFIIRLNKVLEEYRSITYDVLLSPFKGNNKKGKRRRRLDFKMAKKLINSTLFEENL